MPGFQSKQLQLRRSIKIIWNVHECELPSVVQYKKWSHTMHRYIALGHFHLYRGLFALFSPCIRIFCQSFTLRFTIFCMTIWWPMRQWPTATECCHMCANHSVRTRSVVLNSICDIETRIIKFNEKLIFSSCGGGGCVTNGNKNDGYCHRCHCRTVDGSYFVVELLQIHR